MRDADESTGTRNRIFIHRKGRDTMSNIQRVEGHTPVAWMITWHGRPPIEPVNQLFADEPTARAVLTERNSRLPDGAPFRALVPLAAAADIERLEKVNEALVRALGDVLPFAAQYLADKKPIDEKVVTPNENLVSKAKALLSLAKEPA